MLNIMRDDEADPKERSWAEEKAAPYIHPRPAPKRRTIEIDLPDITTVEGIKAAIAEVTCKRAAGSISPFEAQSLVAVIEAQRKTIEMIELVEWIHGWSGWRRLVNDTGTAHQAARTEGKEAANQKATWIFTKL